MREIKFRAWDTKSQRMVYEPYYFDVYHYSDETRANKKTHRYYEDWRSLEDGRGYECELMQYTGLKDKNGKEIYEGDVIEFKSYNVYKKWWSSINEIPEIEESCKRQREAFKTERLVVKFEDGCFVLNWVLTLKDVARGQRYKTGSTRHCDTEEKQWDFEVIGNIYENPELVSSSEIPTEK